MSASNIVAAGLAPQSLPINRGSATLANVAGQSQATVVVPSLSATAQVVLQRTQAAPGAPGFPLGFLSYSITNPGAANASIVIQSFTAAGAALATDVSVVQWAVLDA